MTYADILIIIIAFFVIAIGGAAILSMSAG
jgi:hypothetical protein